jgi:hypothetical protein
MPKSFTLIVDECGGEIIFISRQDDITSFLGGPAANYEGVCLALVMMWFAQDTSKSDPCKGIKNKAHAMNLQSKMEGKWEGFDTVQATATAMLPTKNFWYKSSKKIDFTSEKLGAETYLQHDPQESRESMNIFVIYSSSGGHGIGVWRFSNGTIVLYDPNNGACVLPGKNFRGFLNVFLTELYSGYTQYAVCAFWGAPQ